MAQIDPLAAVPASPTLREYVLLAIADAPRVPEPAPRAYDAPLFARHLDGTCVHIGGRPAVTAVSLDLLDTADANVLGWDGECLTMPGDLRYRPVGLDRHGERVICKRVGR